MSQQPRMKARIAYQKMQALGIVKQRVKPILDNLLELYDGKWDFIEEDNYRVLVDAIFEAAEEEEKEDDQQNVLELDSQGPQQKRLHLDLHDDETSSKKRKAKVSSRVTHPSSSYTNLAWDRAGIDSPGLVVHQLRNNKIENPCNNDDITKERERLKIPLFSDSGKEKAPRFTYIRKSVAYQDAYICSSLTRIADDECCSRCLGNCLLNEHCQCASRNNGEFAYTSKGVLREDFLDSYISRITNPQKHHYDYCKNCPLEGDKDGNMPGPCKGHLVRKFIKECWIKCGCDMKCGNRVVQRGISCKLQVFWTKEGKGWGLRALHDLPKGAFVCEFVGEIMTNAELHKRNSQPGFNQMHTYALLLDADCCSERLLGDKEALCLDATEYGNVARFINHRCCDSNLIDIPVEVETPDHHYYHVAFFTKREVKALEELTWDYCIDFTDDKHPIKAFRCCCGSEFCRDSNSKEPVKFLPDNQRCKR